MPSHRARPALHWRQTTAILLGCTALAPMAALAQDIAPGTVQLPELVLDVDGGGDSETIVADRISTGGKLTGEILEIPGSVSVITSEEIERRGANSVEEVLQYTAGATTDTYGADDRFDYFRIRGFDAYQYRDGLTLGSNFGGIREEPYAFERVEVFKGASSTLFGVSDPGGAVNYVTKVPREEKFGEVYGTVGSFDRKEVGFDFGDTFSEGSALSYRLTGLVRDADREYDYSKNDETFLMAGIAWRPDDATELSFVIDHLDRDDVPGSGGYPTGIDFDRDTFFGEPDYNFRGTERTTATLQYDHDFDGGLSFASTVRYSDEETDFGYAYVTGATGTLASRSFFGNDSAAERMIADARLTYETQFGAVESTTIAGVEAFSENDDSLMYFAGAPSIDYTNPVYTGAPEGLDPYVGSQIESNGTAVFVQQNLDWDDQVIASFGLRHDEIDVADTNLDGVSTEGGISETTGRIGLTYKFTPNISAFASFAQSVLPAGIGVEPEEGEQIELGAKWQPSGTNALITAAVYDLTKTNITRTNPATQLAEPIGEVRVRGFDIEAKAELAGGFDLTAAYAYLDPEIVENGDKGNEGNAPLRVPNHIASVWLNYTLDGAGRRGETTFGLGARYTGEYFFDDANTVSAEDAVIVDAAINYELTENTELALNVANLFDEKHVAYGGFSGDFYNPGRELAATVRYRW